MFDTLLAKCLFDLTVCDDFNSKDLSIKRAPIKNTKVVAARLCRVTFGGVGEKVALFLIFAQTRLRPASLAPDNVSSIYSIFFSISS